MPNQNIKEKTKIPIKEGLILLAFLSIVLFLPLIILHFFENSWDLLSYENRTDFTMLEWTGAFLNIFLFLLILENYRTSGRVMFNFIGSGFLVMGILNFIYAIQSPISETAMWLKTFSIITGSVIFSFSIPTRKRFNNDLTGVLIKYVIPTILLSVLVGWIPFSIRQILPKLINAKGDITIFGSILLLIPCAFFFFTALIWLHEYIKNKRKVDFLIAIIILIFAQMTLIMRYGKPWGVLYWVWHIIWVIDLLIASIYMLILSINRSLVWKLIFSLGFTFSLTVMITSSIIQSHSERKSQAIIHNQLLERHRRILLSNYQNFTYANIILKSLKSNAELFCNENSSYKSLFFEWLKNYLKKRRSEWSDISAGYGFCSSDPEITLNENITLKKRQKKLLKDLNKSTNNESENILWSRFYYSSEEKKWYSFAYIKFKMKGLEGGFFVNVDVSGFVTPNLLPDSDKVGSNSIVLETNNGKLLHASLNKKYLFQNNDNYFQSKINTPLIRKLFAEVYAMDNDSKAIILESGRFKYFISAQKIYNPDLVIMEIVNFEDLPYKKSESRYFFIAVGMFSLLCGFIILLVLLHRQLSRPLNRLILATKKIEKRDFDVRIKVEDETEIGKITSAFNHMAMTLQGLYADLAKTIEERTNALEEAKKADSAKVSFFQNISHELRTPLHGIMSFSRLGMNLITNNKSDKVTKYFKNINISGKRLMLMLDSILDLAKMESDNMSFNFHLADMTRSLEKVKNELEASFIEKNIELIISYPEDKKMMTKIDTEMIERVFRNLLGNALKNSPPYSKVEIKLEKYEDHIKVEIIDEGPGIPEDALTDIFEKFVQGKNGHKKGGTGLGLSICREIIHAHDGLISAENNKNSGACFTFSIPVRTFEENE